MMQRKNNLILLHYECLGCTEIKMQLVEMQIENNFILSTKLTVEGPLRMKEEYTEGVLETPTVDEETIPQQLKGVLGQAVNTVQQLPAPFRDAVSGGLTIPLSEFSFLYPIAYS